MTKEQYEALSRPFRGRPGAVKGLKAANRVLTLSCYLLYPALLLWALVTKDPRLLRLVLVPAVSFVSLSVVRRGLNRPRPYEALDIHPIIHKDTKGNSFPSRHVFSVFVIDMAFWYLCPPLGGVFLVVGIILAATRVLGGVHYPSDVLAGALLAAAAGALGFWVV